MGTRLASQKHIPDSLTCILYSTSQASWFHKQTFPVSGFHRQKISRILEFGFPCRWLWPRDTLRRRGKRPVQPLRCINFTKVIFRLIGSRFPERFTNLYWVSCQENSIFCIFCFWGSRTWTKWRLEQSTKMCGRLRNRPGTVTATNEAGVDLVLIQPFLLYYLNPCYSYAD